ncbi:MAG TPA: hypothetical protein VFF59_10400, partial [Anaerolineae bacterium]|nr:hypothetical protein [Anaerolineae bacterium]
MTTLKDVLDNIGGALMMMGVVIARPIVWGRCKRWGATEEELRRSYPGDGRVSKPITDTTAAVTLHAPAADIWPWIAQIGQERGGMYSYELLENLIGCKMRNADRIAPEWELKVGDLMRMGPPGYPVDQVVALERGHWLLMAGANPKTSRVDPLPQPGQAAYTNHSWLLYLDERPAGTTRLISRTRLD